MIDLTEQWKKGELPVGEYYYYTTIFSPTVHIQNFTRDVVSFQDFKETVAEVLAPVPSYDEWQASEKYNKHLEEVIKVYERKDKQATETSIAYNELLDDNKRLKHDVGNLGYKIKNQRHEIDNRLKEIEKLKELLKECESWFTGIVGNMNDKNVGEHNRKLPIGNFEHAFKVFSQKINQALGEE